MIYNSLKIQYNGTHSDTITPAIKHVTLSSDFYKQSIIGNRIIKEDKIPGRDEPYFYLVDSSPLSFNITIALETPATPAELSTMMQWLFRPNIYKELVFTNKAIPDGSETVYFAMFVGQPIFQYVERGDDTYVGYITATVRCNSNSGFTTKQTINSSFASTTNPGDLNVLPNIELVAAGASVVVVTNNTNGSTFSYTFTEAATVTLNAKTKALATTGSENAYAQWGRNYLELDPGDNNTTISGAYSSLEFTFRAPKYL